MVDNDAVIAAIRKVCGLDADTVLPPDAPLWEMGMDSLRIVELVMLLESELDITFPDEYLVGDTFATVESTLDVVWRFAT
ncbi:phosphopantetheine-binding protein [Actinocrispum wychmicini]|uniref:Acyl carrier protein n=1 Tax=Actinocrispum wychmicini TaxID=1213861 RepID=A0A4V6NNX8_9PSEU|nr:phosphopantetheine-binding protein [Actinocrispum wychmicini]TCO59320.1 acyl carrier protein [Actinocrispum wychmicini]